MPVETRPYKETPLTSSQVASGSRDIISSFARFYGIEAGRLYLQKYDPESGSLVETVELRKVVGEPDLLSIVRVGSFTALARAHDGKPGEISYFPAGGINFHDSHEARKVVSGLVFNRTRPQIR